MPPGKTCLHSRRFPGHAESCTSLPVRAVDLPHFLGHDFQATRCCETAGFSVQAPDRNFIDSVVQIFAATSRPKNRARSLTEEQLLYRKRAGTTRTWIPGGHSVGHLMIFWQTLKCHNSCQSIQISICRGNGSLASFLLYPSSYY